jgi:hypothetical protein
VTQPVGYNAGTSTTQISPVVTGPLAAPNFHVAQPKFHDTPKALARIRNFLTVLIVIWALSSIATLGSVRGSMSKARRASDQVNLIQDTKIKLTRADSLATSGFLVGGLQSDQALAAFAKDIQGANLGLAQVKQGTAGDQVTKSIEAIGPYLTDVTAAQANNRQGFPVGATYQKSASTLMQETVLRPLSDADRQARNQLRYAANGLATKRILRPEFLMFFAVPLIIGLMSLSRRTNRTLNLPVLIGLIVGAVGLIAATALTSSSTKNTLNSLQGPLQTKDIAGQARVALNEAQSAEALTLIARGSGQSYEQQWRKSMGIVDAVAQRSSFSFGSEPALALNYRNWHQNIRDLDDTGDWDAARSKALSESDEFFAAKPFRELDAQLANRATSSVSSEQYFDNGPMALGQVIIAVCGALAVWLVRSGYAQRLKEFR